MKIRSGFVSNSSSSSFILNKEHMTEEQITAVLHYHRFIDDDEDFDGWVVTEEEEYIRGYTIMDNGYMDEYFKKINLGMKAIINYEDGY